MKIKDGETIGCVLNGVTVLGKYNQKNHSLDFGDGVEWFIDVQVFIGMCLWVEG